MLTIDSHLFVQRPEESNRHILHAASIEGITGESYTVRLKESGSSLEVGSEIRIFFEVKNKFMQQAARIEALLDSVEDQPVDHEVLEDEQGVQVLSIVAVGEPSSAENRECYRVLTMFSSMTTKIGNEENCPLLDVSATGFAVISTEKYDSGRIIDVAVYYDGEEFEGRTCVQSVRDMGDGRYRYGMHCIKDRSSDRVLFSGLRKISTQIQREQLQRLSGKAG